MNSGGMAFNFLSLAVNRAFLHFAFLVYSFPLSSSLITTSSSEFPALLRHDRSLFHLSRSLFSSFPRRREPMCDSQQALTYTDKPMWVPSCAGMMGGGEGRRGAGITCLSEAAQSIPPPHDARTCHQIPQQRGLRGALSDRDHFFRAAFPRSAHGIFCETARRL